MQKTIATRIWIILITLTLLAYGLSEQGLSGQVYVLTLLLISLIKGQLIIDRFMMLKSAPLMWRMIISTWLFIVLLTITGVYYAFG